MTKIVKNMTKLFNNSGYYLRFCSHATLKKWLVPVPKLIKQTLSNEQR